MLENGGAWASFLNQHIDRAEHNSRAYDRWRHHSQLCASLLHAGWFWETKVSMKYVGFCHDICENTSALQG